MASVISLSGAALGRKKLVQYIRGSGAGNLSEWISRFRPEVAAGTCPLFGKGEVRPAEYWFDILNQIFVQGLTVWREMVVYGRRVFVMDLTEKGLRLRDRLDDEKVLMFPGRIQRISAESDNSADAIPGITLKRGKLSVKHCGVRIPVPMRCDAATAKPIKELLIHLGYTGSDLEHAKSLMPKKREGWKQRDYMEFYAGKAPRPVLYVAPVTAPHRPPPPEDVKVEEDGPGMDDRVEDGFADMPQLVESDSEEDMDEETEPIGVDDQVGVQVTQGFDECLRCGKTAQDQGGEHGMDGKYMCTACIYKAPLHVGDYAWVHNKEYLPDIPPAVDNPPGFVVRILSVKKRHQNMAKKYRTHWFIQTAVGSTEIRSLNPEGEGSVQKSMVVWSYVRNDLRLVRVDESKHIVSPVALVQAPQLMPSPRVQPYAVEMPDPQVIAVAEQAVPEPNEGVNFANGIVDDQRVPKRQEGIPHAGQDVHSDGRNDDVKEVDCGLDGFVTKPRPGVRYNFPPDNPNFNWVSVLVILLP